jgi:hypothetical protein
MISLNGWRKRCTTVTLHDDPEGSKDHSKDRNKFGTGQRPKSYEGEDKAKHMCWTRYKHYVLFLLHVCQFHSVISKNRVKTNTKSDM